MNINKLTYQHIHRHRSQKGPAYTATSKGLGYGLDYYNMLQGLQAVAPQAQAIFQLMQHTLRTFTHTLRTLLHTLGSSL